MESSNDLEIVIDPLEEIGSFNWFGGELLTKSVNSSGISVGGPHKIMFAPNAVNAQISFHLLLKSAARLGGYPQSCSSMGACYCFKRW